MPLMRVEILQLVKEEGHSWEGGALENDHKAIPVTIKPFFHQYLRTWKRIEWRRKSLSCAAYLALGRTLMEKDSPKINLCLNID